MKKYHIKQLGIEITRRCNYNCIHCMRGDPQDLTIMPEIIDTMFSQLSQVDTIVLYGGESLLEIDMIQYLLEAVDRYDLKTSMFSFITNGSILDSKIIDVMSDFVNRGVFKGLFRVAGLSISLDKYHDEVQSNKALQYYQEINHNSRIMVALADHRDNKSLQYSGRYKEYVDKNMIQIREEGDSVFFCEHSARKRQLCICGDVLECEIQLNANGLITPPASADYMELDNLAFGDILTDSLECIFERHKKTCIATCDECFNERYSSSLYQFRDDATPEEAFSNQVNKIESLVINSIWRFREQIQQKYPVIHAHDIIILTPIPDNTVCENLCNLFIESTDKRDIEKEKQYFSEKYPTATNKQIIGLACLRCAINWLEILYPEEVMRFIYGSSFDEIYELFETLQDGYTTGEIVPPTYFDPCALIPDSVDPRNNNEN